MGTNAADDEGPSPYAGLSDTQLLSLAKKTANGKSSGIASIIKRAMAGLLDAIVSTEENDAGVHEEARRRLIADISQYDDIHF